MRWGLFEGYLSDLLEKLFSMWLSDTGQITMVDSCLYKLETGFYPDYLHTFFIPYLLFLSNTLFSLSA